MLEAEYITPYEFVCNVSLATTLRVSEGKHFILHAQAFYGRPYDDHILKRAVEHITPWKTSEKLFVDEVYRRTWAKRRLHMGLYLWSEERRNSFY